VKHSGLDYWIREEHLMGNEVAGQIGLLRRKLPPHSTLHEPSA